MDGRDSTQSLLLLRKLTRAIAEAVRGQMTDYLATLAPLMRARTVLGDYIEGGSKESTRRAEKAFKDLQELYEKVAATKPYNLPREFTAPIRFGDVGLEVSPVEYPHVIASGSDTRTITVRSPLTWTLSYSGFAPTRLPELLKSKLRPGEDLNQLVMSHLLMHVVINNSPGLQQIMDSLHFPLTTTTVPEFGSLPITRIGVGVTTSRPSDDIVLQTAELTGVDAFEEVVDVHDIAQMRDPFKERLLDIVRQQAPSLVTQS
jgi:hypothetical protein